VASGELYPRVGFIVTNLARPVERLVAFYNHRGTCGSTSKKQGRGQVDPPVMPILAATPSASSSTRCLQSRNFMRTLAMRDGGARGH